MTKALAGSIRHENSYEGQAQEKRRKKENQEREVSLCQQLANPKDA